MKRGFNIKWQINSFIFLMLVVVMVGGVYGQCADGSCSKDVSSFDIGNKISEVSLTQTEKQESDQGLQEYLDDEKHWGTDPTFDAKVAANQENLKKPGASKLDIKYLTTPEAIETITNSPETYDALKNYPDKFKEFNEIALKEKTGLDLNMDNYNTNDMGFGDDGKTFYIEGKGPFDLENLNGLNTDGSLQTMEIESNGDVVFNKDLPGEIRYDQGAAGTGIGSCASGQCGGGSASPGGGGAGGASGGGGSGAGGGSAGSAGGQQNQLAQFQQIFGLVQQLLGAIPKPEGKTNVNSNNQLAFNDGGGAYFPGSGVDVEQNCYTGFGPQGECLDEPSVVRARGEDTIGITNTLAMVPEQADIYSPANPETDLLLAGIPGDAPGTAGLEPLYGASITAAVISDLGPGQYVKLIGHDLGLGGNRILVDILKTFDEIQGDGSELWIKNGNMYTKFDGIKIYYSKRIKNSDHSIGLIDNVRDSENHFSLIKYKNNRARLIDAKKRVSVGDLVVPHPRENGLNIAKVRDDMWVER